MHRKIAELPTKRIVLLAENDINAANDICLMLQSSCCLPVTVGDGEQLKQALIKYHPELVLFDAELPGAEGIQMIEWIRRGDSLPIIVMSDNASEEYIIKALDAGADDYMVKPVTMGELAARIRVQLRHADKLATSNGKIVRVKDCVIDLSKRRVTVAGEEIRLTAIEYKIICILALNVGKVLAYDYIIREIWGASAEENNRTLRVNIANIRKKLQDDVSKPKYIVTESGVGYRMLED